jgi:hypothetical protein
MITTEVSHPEQRKTKLMSFRACPHKTMERDVKTFSQMIYQLRVAHFGVCLIPYLILIIHGAIFGKW